MAAPALLRHVFTRPTADPDADLLARFAARRDPDAFAELVRRHGPVVYRVCRRLLGEFAADDAFQATFLVLATRPGSVRKAGSVGSWLVGVAGRVARQTRKARHRRAFHEQASGRREPAGGKAPDYAEQFRILDEELTRLPDRLRSPVVLCLLQGRTQEQAAVDLGGSVRTVRRRLDEAKHLLRTRLERRGVVPAVAAGLAGGVGSVTAAVPADLFGRTVATVFDFLAGGAATTAPAAVLAHGVASTMLARKLMAAMTAMAVGLTALGVGLADDGTKPKPDAPATIPPPNVPVPAPAPAVNVSDPPPLAAGYTSPNFVVHASDSEVARQVSHAAEVARVELALTWLGCELPKWEKPCPIHVEIQMSGSGGATTLTYSDDPKKPAVRTMEMKLFGDLQTILRDTVRHEVMHCMLATHFGKPVPRWADEGIAVGAEGTKSRAEHDARCRELMNQGRGISLKALFGLKEYPKDMAVLFAQGYSVCEFLAARTPGEVPPADPFGVTTQYPDTPLGRRMTLLKFVDRGLSPGWEQAAKEVYGFDSLDALQEAWVAWLKQPPKAASTIPSPATGSSVSAPKVASETGPSSPPVRPNFVVRAPQPAVARALVNELEQQRTEQAKRWLGRELPQWPEACQVWLAPDPRRGDFQTGRIEFRLAPQVEFRAVLGGQFDLLLTESVPYYVTHLVLISHIGDRPPAWVWAGALRHVYPPDSPARRVTHQAAYAHCCEALIQGKALRLRTLFEYKSDGPKDQWDLCQDEGYAVAKYLLIRGDHPKLVQFIRSGMQRGWDAAARDVYGFDGVDKLESAWIDWMRQNPPPRIGPSDPTRIPPVKLSGDDTGKER